MANKKTIKKSALAPTVLIAGGAGFVGSHLAEAFLLRDARVIVVDDLSHAGKDIYVNSLLENPKFALFNSNINQEIPKEIESVDYIIHLAGFETYLYSQHSFNLDSLLTNALGTKNLLDLAHRSGAKFLLASSINVYQGLISPSNLDFYFGKTQEEENKYSLTEAKRFAEALVWEYYKKNQTDVRIARLPEVYGPRMSLASSGNLGRLMKALIDGKPLTVFGEGTEKEHYLYISDAVSGLVKALFAEGSEGKIYTLVDKEPYAVLETTFLLKSMANGTIDVEFKPQTNSGFRNEVLALDKSTAKELKWEPKTQFREGIEKTLKWLGYEVNNTKGFKPAKLIEDKKKEIEAAKVGPMQLGFDTSAYEPKDKKPEQPEVEEKKTASLIVKKVDPNAPSLISKIFSPILRILGGLKNFIVTAKSRILPKRVKLEWEILPYKDPKAKEQKEEVFSIASGSQNDSKAVGEEIASHQPPKPLHKAVIPYVTAVLVSLVLVTTALPASLVLLNGNRAKASAENLLENIETLDFEAAEKNSEILQKGVSSTLNAYDKLGPILNSTGFEDEFFSTKTLLSSFEHFSIAIKHLTAAASPISELWEVIKPNTTATLTPNQLTDSQLHFKDAKTRIELAKAELQKVNRDNIPKILQKQIGTYERVLDLTDQAVEFGNALALDIPKLLGESGTRKYLILLQNSNEIRPTGGFIGSYAILEFTDGKISTLTIDDIYNPDGQIDLREIEIAPPEPIKQYLEEEVLHIRNANWDPDFRESSETIMALFKEIDGREFDGVIGIDLYMAKKLLEVTGPIYLAAYDEEINTENVYERTQYHSEFNFEEGSEQKKSFLTLMGSKLLESLFDLDNKDMFGLVTKLAEASQGKHLLVYLPDSTFSSYLNERGWDGSLITPKEGQDYLYVVNANVGGTKSNYFVGNAYKYEVSAKTRDGVLRGKLTLNYKHVGEDDSWPGGPYTNYVRVLTKPGTKLTGAQYIANVEIQDIFEKVVTSNVGPFTSYEFGFTVNPQEEAYIIFEYDLSPDTALTTLDKTYDLYWQKQPGTMADSAEFIFEPPFGLEVVDGSAEVNTVLVNDLEIGVGLK